MRRKHDSRKQTLYIREPIITELQAEAVRLGWSVSKVVQQCIRSQMAALQAMPTQEEP